MSEPRERIVELWAMTVQEEITQLNYWFQIDSSWKDIDVIGTKPGTDHVSIYNVKANINTGVSYSPEKIGISFIDSIRAMKIAYGDSIQITPWLIYQSADRFGSGGKERAGACEEYRKAINQEIEKSGLVVQPLRIMHLLECYDDIIGRRKKVKFTYCFEHGLKAGRKINVYPFHKYPELAIIGLALGRDLPKADEEDS
jgi:hypothetical protein